MPIAEDVVNELRDHIADLCHRFDVPGAVLGLHVDGAQAFAAHGSANLHTGVRVTPDTLFQIGSISKVYTATAVMRLVARGELDLDTPVSSYLPDLRLADPDALSTVTIRHLLTHTSGLEGDIFTDTGRGDDCIARYVGLLGDIAQPRPAGAGFSYCNSGFVVLGHLLERMTGRTWDKVLADEVTVPLDLGATVTLPEEALMRRTAVGHSPDPSGSMVPTRSWTYPRAIGPAGLVCSDARDLLRFAVTHLSGGTSPDGSRFLPTELCQDMRDREVEVPGGWPGTAWGLGWICYDWADVDAVGHDGGTLGQRAALRLVPERDVAITVLTNSTTGALVARRIVTEAMRHLGIAVPPLPTANPDPATAPARARHVGVFGRVGETWSVSEAGDGLLATVSTDLTDLAPASTVDVPLEPIDAHRFLVRSRGEPDSLVVFGGEDGSSDWLYNGRINPRRNEISHAPQ